MKTNDRRPAFYREGYCTECGAPSVVEPGRGWWCARPGCRLAKTSRDTRKRDKYRPTEHRPNQVKPSDTHTTDVCSECPGRCCRTRGFGHTMLALTDEEACRPGLTRYAELLVCGWYIRFVKGRCPALADGRCSVYEDRPNACRGFVCYTGNRDFRDMPTHRRLLNRWRVLPGQEFGTDLPDEH